jgi:hypothetical protein
MTKEEENELRKQVKQLRNLDEQEKQELIEYSISLPYKQKIKEIINVYGEEHQINKAIEEMAELTKELIKYQNKHQEYLTKEKIIKNIKQELADVEVMIEQIKIIFNFTQNEIDEIKQRKVRKVLL